MFTQWPDTERLHQNLFITLRESAIIPATTGAPLQAGPQVSTDVGCGVSERELCWQLAEVSRGVIRKAVFELKAHDEWKLVTQRAGKE